MKNHIEINSTSFEIPDFINDSGIFSGTDSINQRRNLIGNGYPFIIIHTPLGPRYFWCQKEYAEELVKWARENGFEYEEGSQNKFSIREKSMTFLSKLRPNSNVPPIPFESSKGENYYYRATSLGWVIVYHLLYNKQIKSYYYEGTIVSRHPTESMMYYNDWSKSDYKKREEGVLLRLLGLESVNVSPEIINILTQPVLLEFEVSNPNRFVQKDLALTANPPLKLSELSDRSKAQIIESIGVDIFEKPQIGT